MKIIRKSDIKKYKREEKEELDELVDAEGNLTTGDKVLNSDSQITTGNPTTSDDHEEGTVQHRDRFGYGSTAYSRGIKPVAESKIKSIIEDIINNQKKDNELVSDKIDVEAKIDKFVKTIKSDETIDTEDIIKRLRDKFNTDAE